MLQKKFNLIKYKANLPNNRRIFAKNTKYNKNCILK